MESALMQMRLSYLWNGFVCSGRAFLLGRENGNVVKRRARIYSSACVGMLVLYLFPYVRENGMNVETFVYQWRHGGVRSCKSDVMEKFVRVKVTSWSRSCSSGIMEAFLYVTFTSWRRSCLQWHHEGKIIYGNARVLVISLRCSCNSDVWRRPYINAKQTSSLIFKIQGITNLIFFSH